MSHGVRRRTYTIVTPILQVGLAAGLAVLLSRWGRDDPSGWGDLIGAVVGIVLGPGVGLAVVLFLVGRARGGSVARSLSVALLAVPTGLAVGVAAGLLDVEGWVIYGVYLAASTMLVWWFAGRPSIAD